MNLIKENLRYYEACLEKWGADSQFSMLQEECAEVIQAVSKIWRKQPLAFNKLVAELVDLQLMLDQAKLWLRLNDMENDYDIQMDIKLKRLGRLLDE